MKTIGRSTNSVPLGGTPDAADPGATNPASTPSALQSTKSKNPQLGRLAGIKPKSTPSKNAGVLPPQTSVAALTIEQAGVGAAKTVSDIARPGNSQAVPASLDHLGFDMLEQIGQHFELGTPHASSLARTNKSLKAHFSQQALVDGLVSRCNAGSSKKDVCLHFQAIVEQMYDLPEELQAKVLAHVPKKWCDHLNHADAANNVVLAEESTSGQNTKAPTSRIAVIQAAVELFNHEKFKAHVSKFAGQSKEQVTLERFYNQLCLETALPADKAESDVRLAQITGLHILSDPQARSSVWLKGLNEARQSSEPVEKTRLVLALSETLSDLLVEKRFNALLNLDDILREVPRQARPEILFLLANKLKVLASQGECENAIGLLRDIALSCPPFDPADPHPFKALYEALRFWKDRND